MRTHGTLTRWNADRGFGFITLAQPGDELFVHISAFPRSPDAPRIGELISFEIEPGKDGRRQAVRVMRAGAPAAGRGPRRQHAAAQAPSTHRLIGLGKLLLLLLVAVAGGYAYLDRDTQMPAPAPPETSSAVPARAPADRTPPDRAALQSSPAVTAAAAAGKTSATPAPTPHYSCGGRKHCSQMTSCDDATWVLRNCPGTKMDGDNDGVPCEDQLCR
ncbi:excalibur calcium-binding domain-containing protein [Xanthomonas prunicola]|jgi:cold shock CspA family protein|uniref:Cold-shock protein n=1 Tax=Xanthomonas prunicola TaxID=2053930 RepID=A0A2N3RN68_9XANT|nr:excalibur calcium-binding domain-containing protein [Xanthomonas prunicola]PKV13928.1 cold-shock protein [Xanthomonas prunicola]PKV18208.1 cold-shock protein [Xanthomonas prunicola]PKV22481.1 cold-shock protein [Xanthomonas prunicola]